jgi:hypothetical protein
MVEIEYTPVKRVKILEVIQFSRPEDLAKQIAVLARAGQPVILAWAEGVLFLSFPLEPNVESVVKDLLRGTIVLSSVQYSPMPKYKPIIKAESPELGVVELPVVDVSLNNYSDLLIFKPIQQIPYQHSFMPSFHTGLVLDPRVNPFKLSFHSLPSHPL